MQKSYWLLELPFKGRAYYIGFAKSGFSTVSDWVEANRYVNKKDAENRLIELRMAHPNFPWDEIKINEHGEM